MYKLGYTSGLAEAKCDEGKETIKVVGDIVDKLAKKCEDVPKKMLAPSKITEVTNGCFSSAQIVEVCDEFGGGASSSESESEAEAEQAAEQAAKTSGSCGGGKSSKQNKKEDTACKKSCCGGKVSSTNACTGSKLVDMLVPSTLSDMLGSSLGAYIQDAQLTESQFKHMYCDNTPYPECATCPYNTKLFQTIQRDTDALFRMIDDAINQLMFGNYDLATAFFQCPGQLNSLLRSTLGPVGDLAAAGVTGALIALTAARGAMAAFDGISRAARFTDHRISLMRSIDKLFRSGSLVGKPGKFASAVSGILTSLGCSSNTLCRITSRSNAGRSSCFGASCNLWGDRPSGRTYVDIPYRSNTRLIASVITKEKAEKALDTVKKPLTIVTDLSDNPVRAEETGTNKPTSERRIYTPTEDKITRQDTIYYRDTTDPETGKTKKEVIPLPPGEDVELLENMYGPIYVIEDNGVTLPDPVIETTDPKVVDGKTYVVRDPVTDETVNIRKVVPDIAPGMTMDDVKTEIAKVYDVDPQEIKVYDRTVVPRSRESYRPTKDKTAKTGKDYFEIDSEGHFTKKDLNPGDPIPSGTYDKTTVPPGTEDDATVYTGTEPLVLDTGLIVEVPIFLDAASQDMAVDTQSLITQTGVMAGDMEKIEGIGLDIYEIKMGYLLDHLRNGTVLPVDVEADLIPTVLDTIADDAA